MNARCAIALLLLAAGVPSCRRRPAPSGPAVAPPVVSTATGVEMVLLPGGWFEMGSGAAGADERPVHRVWVDAFLIDRTEVTQAQFRRLQIPDPSHFKDPNRPVEQVTLADAIEYCNERSAAEGLRPCYTLDRERSTWTCDFDADGYRLPTEAEWEYACRAGSGGERFFPGGEPVLKQHAWYAANAANQTHSVGRKRPNPWGLYDMYGNVAEWCNDGYDPNAYAGAPQRNPRGPVSRRLVVVRGGSWKTGAEACRSAWRAGESPRFHDVCFTPDTIGFRCVRKAPQ